MQAKKERAIVDFQDLEHFCLAILLDEKSTETNLVSSTVALSFQKQFREILIDENNCRKQGADNYRKHD